MQTVHRSTVFAAPISAVWAVIRDFDGWPRWVPAIATSEIEGGGRGDVVGCVRLLTVPPDGTARERLVGLDDYAHTVTYAVEETSAPPMSDYVATIRLRTITDGGGTFAEWTGSFVAAPEDEAAIADAVAAVVYESGFAGIRALLGASVIA